MWGREGGVTDELGVIKSISFRWETIHRKSRVVIRTEKMLETLVGKNPPASAQLSRRPPLASLGAGCPCLSPE